MTSVSWSPDGRRLAVALNNSHVQLWDTLQGSSRLVSGFFRVFFLQKSTARVTRSNIFPSTQLRTLRGHKLRVGSLDWNDNILTIGGMDGMIINKDVHVRSHVVGTYRDTLRRHERELLSSHGFTDNQVTVWKYPSMTKISELFGHTLRVLHMAQSPDGYIVATAAADETLTLWNVFGNPEENKPVLKRKLEPFFNLAQIR
ncbi:cell division cycle 20.2, cofactor of APC complex-like [Capsicum annuum]|uniref:cell division cycle 20.2, cofactor of APC complex-like n=1 Tax=Capsicum annuum TaxID=4072 RepID=UPI001FB17A55|nr:cell division cycle 20.2, cofactor of APC complex-like [Capsicum annuum]